MGAFSTRFRRGVVTALGVAVLAAGPASTARAGGSTSAPTTERASDRGLAALLAVPLPGVAEIGGRLLLNGRPHFFAGINAYNATTYWPVNHGCGSMIDNLDTLYGALPRHSLVRTWAFQALAVNKFTHQVDFTAIDRAVAAAKAHHDFLILTLSDQAGTCDDERFHDADWYAAGYRAGFLQWVKTVVRRYRNDRTVAIYEPVNEPEASNCLPGLHGGHCYGHNTCPARATHVLRTFFDTIGGAIKRLDPRALVSSGTLGGTQCGVAGDGFRRINASPDIDVTTLHDYGYPTVASTGGLVERSAQATALDKVFLVEESGIDASLGGAGCMTLTSRARAFQAKEQAARRVGADGYLPWMFGLAPSSGCSSGIASGDPLLLSHLAR